MGEEEVTKEVSGLSRELCGHVVDGADEDPGTLESLLVLIVFSIIASN